MLPKHTSGVARKRILFLLGALLVVNATVAHIVTAQIAEVADDYKVKDDQVVVEEATEENSGTDTPQDGQEAPSITIYTVKSGDTISSIAKKFGVSQNTVLWANELTAKSTLKVGKALVILPINGLQYTVKKGDTISGIASKFKADEEEILYFNDLDDPKAIQPGIELIIPDAEPVSTPKPAPKPAPKAPTPTPTQKTTPAPVASAFPDEDTHDHEAETSEEKEEEKSAPETPPSSGRYGKFTAPAPGSVLTQGYHAINAVDFGAPVGSPILAAMEGTVIVSKMGCATGSPRNGCNGGFGNFIVISHDNGVQTLYAHLSKTLVSVGDSVDQGEKIGLMGNTGRSTGSHLHFEVHGEKNPFTKDRKFTKY